MPRPLALVIALVFALPLLAAPVPKAVKAKASAAPQVVGTTWLGTNSGMGTFEYTFHEDGKFSATTNGRPYTGGTWKLDGDTLEWEFNNRFSVYTVTFKDGGFEGKAENIKGKSWDVTLTPKGAAEK